mgnify:CR=1 FL=1
MPKDLAGKRAKQELIATSSTIHRRQHTSKQTKVSINQLHGHPSLTQTTTNHTVYTTGTTHRHTKHHPHYNGYTLFTNKHQMHQTEPQTERTAVPCAFGQFCTYSTIFDTTPVVAKEHKKHSISAKTCRDRAPNRETVWSNANTETKSLQQTIRSVVDNNINQFGSRSRVHQKCSRHWNARRWNPNHVPPNLEERQSDDKNGLNHRRPPRRACSKRSNKHNPISHHQGPFYRHRPKSR